MELFLTSQAWRDDHAIAMRICRIPVPAMECIATMPWHADASPYMESRNPEEYLLGIRILRCGPYVVGVHSLTHGNPRGMWAACSKLGLSGDLVPVNCTCSLVRPDDPFRILWPSYLLTSEEKKHIINTKDRCGPGASSRQALRVCLYGWARAGP